MPETGKTRTLIICLALLVLVVAGGVALWRFLNSEAYGIWRFERKLARLAEEGIQRGREMQFVKTDGVEIRIANSVLEEDGRFIRPAAVEFTSSRDTVLTRYDLTVWDDLNDNNTQDPGEPAWTWLEVRAEGIPCDEIYEPPRKPVAEQAEEIRNPYYRLKLADSVSDITSVTGIVNPLMKLE